MASNATDWAHSHPHWATPTVGCEGRAASPRGPGTPCLRSYIRGPTAPALDAARQCCIPLAGLRHPRREGHLTQGAGGLPHRTVSPSVLTHGSLLCQGRGFGALDCAPALVAVKVVRPVGRCTLTAPARRRGLLGAEAAWGVAGGGVAGSVWGAGPGSGWSEEPASGCESVTLESESFPCCPPGPVFGAVEVVTVCVIVSLSICW